MRRVFDAARSRLGSPYRRSLPSAHHDNVGTLTHYFGAQWQAFHRQRFATPLAGQQEKPRDKRRIARGQRGSLHLTPEGLA